MTTSLEGTFLSNTAWWNSLRMVTFVERQTLMYIDCNQYNESLLSCPFIDNSQAPRETSLLIAITLVTCILGRPQWERKRGREGYICVGTSPISLLYGSMAMRRGSSGHLRFWSYLQEKLADLSPASSKSPKSSEVSWLAKVLRPIEKVSWWNLSFFAADSFLNSSRICCM